ncbi:MAG TPA: FG-GAP-like repeat-containing protein [Flavobacteriales bacterium]
MYLTHRILGLLAVVCSLEATAQFAYPQIVQARHLSASLAWGSGDVGNDGDTDLIAYEYGSIHLFEYHQDQDAYVRRMIVTAGPEDFYVDPALEVLDMDNDGINDIVVGDDEGIRFLKGLPGATFAPITLLHPLVTNDARGGFADMDGDGDTDVYAISGNGVIMLLNDGAGALSATPPFTTINGSSTLSKLFRIDLDGDGLQDLLSMEQNTDVRVHRNLGGGTMESLTTLTTVSTVVPFDLDDDGLDDVVIRIGGNLMIHRNQGNGSFGPQELLVAVPAAPLFAADPDADGDMDLLYVLDDELKGLMNTNGTLQQSTLFGGPTEGLIQVFRHNGVSSVILERIGGGQLVYRAAPDGTFSAHSLLDGDPGEYFTLADLDGNGHKDLVFGNADYKVHWSPSDGASFGAPRLLFVGEGDYLDAITCGDVDSDGDQDVIIGGMDGWDLLRNDGAGGFVKEQLMSFTTGRRGELMVVDMNGDGLQDIVRSAGNFGSGMFFLRNTGTGDFDYIAGGVNMTFFAGFQLIGVKDLDEDGLKDLIVYDANQGVCWFRHLGNFSFATRVLITAELTYGDVVDVNMDGHLDLMMTLDDTAPMAAWMEGQGDGTFGPVQPIFEQGTCTFCRTQNIDLDGDGDPDALLFHDEEPTAEYTLNDGTGQFSPLAPLTTTDIHSTVERRFQVTDADGDGDQDVVYRRIVGYGGAQVALLENLLGGAFSISGKVFADLDGDATHDAGEPLIPGALVTVAPEAYAVWSADPTGSYVAYAGAGDYLVSAQVPAPGWMQTTDPVTHTAQLSTDAPAWNDLDFGFFPNGDIHTVVPRIVTSASSVCSEAVPLWVDYTNLGTYVERGTVAVMLDTLCSFLSSEPPPDAIIGDTLYWDFEDLSYFEMRGIQLVVEMPGVDHLGDTLFHQVEVRTTDEDGAPTEIFTAELDDILVCAYDPNDKQVHPRGIGPSGIVDIGTEQLEYTIRFQNTGSAPAQDVVLRDQLREQLDPMTILVTAHSHVPTHVAVEAGGELVVRFLGIQLPDSASDPIGSQGFITFRIGVRPGLPHTTEIVNSVGIYFDQNPPILTNSTLNTLVDCGLWEAEVSLAGAQVLLASEGVTYQWYLDEEILVGATQQQLLVLENGAYTVQTTSIHGCVAQSAPFVVTGMGVDGYAPPTIGAMPNPFSSGTLLVCSVPLSGSDRIELFDVHGRLVRSMRGEGSMQLFVPRADLADGLYVVRVLRNGIALGSLRVIVE